MNGAKTNSGGQPPCPSAPCGAVTTAQSLGELKVGMSPWERLVAKLPEIHKEYLAKVPAQALDPEINGEDAKLVVKPGGIVKHKDLEFVAKAILGYGAEGCVYLVDTPSGECALKAFYRSNRLRANIMSLRKMGDAGIPISRIESVSYKTKSLLAEYIPSIPQDHFFGGRSKLVSIAEAEALGERLQAFREAHAALYDHGGYSVQCVVSVSSGDLRVVDPR